MRAVKSNSIKDIATVIVFDSEFPDFFDSVSCEGKIFSVLPSHGYGDNAIAVKGKYDFNGKNVSFLHNGKTVKQ